MLFHGKIIENINLFQLIMNYEELFTLCDKSYRTDE